MSNHRITADDVNINPDCRDSKHPACAGTAWNYDTDTPTACECACHPSNAPVSHDPSNGGAR